MKTLEERIYESLGVLYFKKLVVSMGKFLRKGSTISRGDNYFLHELSANGIKNFKKSGIKFNSIVHAISLSFCLLAIPNISSTSSLVTNVFWTIVNTYCLMLQRYNNIRLNKIYDRMKEREERKEKLEIDRFKEPLIMENKLDYTLPSSNKNQSTNPNIWYLKYLRDNLVEQKHLTSGSSLELTKKRTIT